MIYEFDGFRLDIGAFELSRDGRSVPLERQVYDVLAYLVQNHERLVPKEELLEKVWGDRFVSDAALNSRVMAARKAIGDSGKEQRLIRTVHGRGYRFVGDVGSAAAEAGSQARSVPSVALTGGRLPEPSIRYATARDGVSIAYWVMGEGPPLLYMPSAVFNPVDRALRTPEGRRWVEELASRRTVIRYDHRGFGQSPAGCRNLLAGRLRLGHGGGGG